jgi:hypothetical protein
MASASQLSESDWAVLSAILDPESGIKDGYTFVTTSAPEPSYYERDTAYAIRREEREILVRLNTETPSAKVVQNALGQLDKLIKIYPNHASSYNNRAQTRRLLFKDLEDLAGHPGQVSAIMADLAQAISLASPEQPTKAVSSEVAQVLASAHTHRAYLLLKCSQMQTSGIDHVASIAGLGALESDTLLEMASRDFAIAGRYGNRTAKQLAVHTNPYAKLCGSIVKEALRKEFDACGDET